MSLKHASKEDPRGLIADSYEIEGISIQEARSIFFDWAMRDSRPDPREDIEALWHRLGKQNPDHPMSQILKEALEAPRRDRRRRRRESVQ